MAQTPAFAWPARPIEPQGPVVHYTDELLLATPEWSHETVLDCYPPNALARAFVSHHLVAHRLFHLVDAASVVAIKLVSDAVMRTNAALTLTLAKADDVVLLSVEARPSERAKTAAVPAVVEPSFGSRIVRLLSLQWGVIHEAGAVKARWATFDARHRHARATVQDSMAVPRQAGPPPTLPGSFARHGIGEFEKTLLPTGPVP